MNGVLSNLAVYGSTRLKNPLVLNNSSDLAQNTKKYSQFLLRHLFPHCLIEPQYSFAGLILHGQTLAG